MVENDDIPEEMPPKRELFASLAMNGLCSAIHNYHGQSEIDPEAIATDAVAIADALIRLLDTV